MYRYQYFRVSVYSHFVKLTHVTPRGREVVETFLKNYILMGLQKEGRRWVRKPVKVFAARVRDGSEYRFHINQLEHFRKVCADAGVGPEFAVEEVQPMYTPAPSNLRMLPFWKPRDYQEPILEYLRSLVPNNRKLVEIQPGKGKTYLSTQRAVDTGHRIIVIIKPSFMKKWAQDFEKHCGIPWGKIPRINGSGPLMNLITTAKEGNLKDDVIIISTKTMQNWFKEYERKGRYSLDQGYDCFPEEFFPLLGAGVRIIDEVHLEYHLNFKMDLYCHCPLTISLSATLISDDPFIARMQEVGYPRAHRYAGLDYDRYIEATALFYRVKRPDWLRTTEWGSVTYSHHVFEASVIKHPELLQGFLQMTYDTMRDYYLKDYEPGFRCLVYCASIQMCTIMTEYLKKKFPDKDVRRYVEEDPYENLMEAEISVSTPQSAGTGHDIDLLSTVILTPAVKSSAANIQGFGRLRNLPVTNPKTCANMKLRFVYMSCLDVDKHMEYQAHKHELLLTRALICKTSNYPLALG